MRIGIDGSTWTNYRGYGRYTRSLVSEMVRRDERNSYVIVIDDQTRGSAELPPRSEVCVVPVGVSPTASVAIQRRRGIRDVLRMSRAAGRAGCDVFFFPTSYSYYPTRGVPIVVTIHDAIAERVPHLTMASRRSRAYWTLKQRLAVRQAKAIVTVSEASRAALLEALPISAQRLHVIREAPADIFSVDGDGTIPSRLKLREDDPYFLYVGGISPHKNLGVLVSAFESVARERKDVRLVLVGETADEPFLSDLDSVRGAIVRSPVRDSIVIAGYVTDDELAALYRGATATVLPSVMEGFGLPAAESAACGTPVVASSDAALKELLGDAGLYFDHHDVEGLARHLRTLLDDDDARTERRSAVLARVEGLSWAAAADRTIEILEQVAHRG